MTTLTSEQLHILQHSLGVDQYGQGEMYRNRFRAGGKDVAKCQELTKLGYMVERPPVFNDPWWSVTEEGIKAVLEQSPKPQPKGKRWKCLAPWRDPKSSESDGYWFDVFAETRSKARYQAFLELSDLGIERDQFIYITVRAA